MSALPVSGIPGRLDLEFLLAARRHIQIIHHLPGRLRLRFDPVGLGAALAGRPGLLETALADVPGVGRTEVNLGARSVIVHYNVAVLPADLWTSLFTGSPAAAAVALQRVLPANPSVC